MRPAAGVDRPGICWNATGAQRLFQPVVLNLSKDKRVLFHGSDKARLLGHHEHDIHANEL